MTVTKSERVATWDGFLSRNRNVEFVWVVLLPFTANKFVRMIPVARFTELVNKGQHISFPKVAFHVTPGDRVAEGGSMSDVFYLRPDPKSAYCQAGSNGTRATVLADCVRADGSPIEECAKSNLEVLCGILRELGFNPLVGFEVEVVFLRIKQRDESIDYEPVKTQHSWSGLTSEDAIFFDLIEAIARTLASMDVHLEQFHAEAAPAQWEFVLPPSTPVEATSTLLKARDTIMSVAASFGYRATLHPRLYPDHNGTGSHTHFSIQPMQIESEAKVESFFAGIIEHLPSILAFTLPLEISYERMKSGIWSGGDYAAWGWENKETPLRRVSHNHFELKLVDGFANPYLVLSALFAAGIDGIRSDLPLTAGPCAKAPGKLSEDERYSLGVHVKLPTTLEGTLEALEANETLTGLIGPRITTSYIEVKRGEMAQLRAMSEDARRVWLITRY